MRQKRIRLLNERTSVATADRYHRAEELVSEMRADLTSLKQRLDEELTELGEIHIHFNRDFRSDDTSRRPSFFLILLTEENFSPFLFFK